MKPLTKLVDMLLNRFNHHSASTGAVSGICKEGATTLERRGDLIPWQH
ncbi:hypothetical protein [Heyndrickxia camelliae]|nr:hypothetical protein [Heyndrickxia camelliae]